MSMCRTCKIKYTSSTAAQIEAQAQRLILEGKLENLPETDFVKPSEREDGKRIAAFEGGEVSEFFDRAAGHKEFRGCTLSAYARCTGTNKAIPGPSAMF